MYLSSRFVLAALPFLALIVNAVPSPVHVPAIGPIRAPTPPMPNPDGHQGQTYVSQQWKEENNKKDPAGKAQGQQEMNAAHPVVQDWQKHNGINQPGGHKQEDHVLKYGLSPFVVHHHPFLVFTTFNCCFSLPPSTSIHCPNFLLFTFLY